MASTITLIVLSGCILRLAFESRHVLRWLAEKLMTSILPLLCPVKSLADGRPIPGPGWKWIDGQTIDKFIDGRACSRRWQQYGPIYRIWAGNIPEVVITRPEDIRAFHSDSSSHEKARSSNAGWLFHQLLGECMGLINGSRWTKLRSEFGPSFTHPSVAKKADEISLEARLYIEDLPKKPYAACHSNKDAGGGAFAVRAAQAVSEFPFFCTATHLYGPLNNDERERLWSLGQRSMGLMGHVLSGGLTRFGMTRYLSGHISGELNEFHKQWAQFNRDVYTLRMKLPSSSSPSSSSSPPRPPIVSAWELVEGGTITEDELLHTLSEILFANLDVSTGVFSWLLYFISKDDLVQQELREEIRQQDNRDGQGAAEYCGRKDTLLSYCLQESFRLRPFTAFSIPESSPKEKILGGYRIPAHTSVVVDTVAVNLNKEFWGDDSEEFRPKRFQSMKATDLRYNLFVFGFGTRKCLGQHFGELMLKLFVVHLLSQYTITPTFTGEVEPIEKSRDSWVPLSGIEVVLAPLQK